MPEICSWEMKIKYKYFMKLEANGSSNIKYLGAKGQSHKIQPITGIYNKKMPEICSSQNDGIESKYEIFVRK